MTGTQDYVVVAADAQLAEHRLSDEAPVASNINLGILVHHCAILAQSRP